MTRRAASSAETRKLILDAARDLFFEIGVEGCTMRRIGARAGVAPASVVVHFKNKVLLLEAVLGEAIEAQLGAAMATMPECANLERRLLHMASAFFHLYGENKDLYRALIRDTSFEPEAADSHLGALNKVFLGSVAQDVGNEQRAGRVRPSVDPVMAASALFSLYLGTLMHFLRLPELAPTTAVNLLGVMTGDYMGGILVEEAGRC